MQAGSAAVKISVTTAGIGLGIIAAGILLAVFVIYLYRQRNNGSGEIKVAALCYDKLSRTKKTDFAHFNRTSPTFGYNYLEHYITFQLSNRRTLLFKVTLEEMKRIHKGMSGGLVYAGRRFISFTEDKKYIDPRYR